MAESATARTWMEKHAAARTWTSERTAARTPPRARACPALAQSGSESSAEACGPRCPADSRPLLRPLRPRPRRRRHPQPWRSPRVPLRPSAPCASARPESRCAPTAATVSAGRAWCASGPRRTGPSRAPSVPMTAGSAPWSPAALRLAAASWRSRRRPRRRRATALPARPRCSCCAAPTETRCAPPAAWPLARSRPSGNRAGGRRCAARCAPEAVLQAAHLGALTGVSLLTSALNPLFPLPHPPHPESLWCSSAVLPSFPRGDCYV